jgi:hypothetical protein
VKKKEFPGSNPYGKLEVRGNGAAELPVPTLEITSAI